MACQAQFSKKGKQKPYEAGGGAPFLRPPSLKNKSDSKETERKETNKT